MLFSLFINNLVPYIKNAKCIMFADDVQIYIECDISAIDDAIEIINGELANIVQFGTDYGIDINPSKTKAIIMSSRNNLHKLEYNNLPNIIVGGDNIEYVSEVRNLGFYLNRTMSSEAHIENVRKKVYGSLNSIWPLKNLLPPGVKLQLIKTLIYPIIDYMDVVYHDFDVHGTRGSSEKLEKLLNVCIRYVLNVKRHEHITPHREELNMPKLFERRVVHVAGMIHKILNNETPSYLHDIVKINDKNMRSQNKLFVQRPATNFHKTSFYVGGPKLWNALPNNIREIECYQGFVTEVMNYFISKE